MAGAPFSQQIVGRSISNVTRQINNEYHLELIAKNSKDEGALGAALLRGQHELLRAQVDAATLNLRAQAEIARRQELTNELLGGVSGNLDALLHETQQMTDQLFSIESTLEAGINTIDDTLHHGFASVIGVLERAVATLIQQQRKLAEIADLSTNRLG